MDAVRTPRLLGDRGSDNVVAVLYLEGEIVDGWGETTNIGGDRFAAELRQLRKDDDVKAVVLRVNSPGGSAYASEVIQREIINLKASKNRSSSRWATTPPRVVTGFRPTPTVSSPSPTRSPLHWRLRHVHGRPEIIQQHLGVTFDTAKTGAFSDFETISRPKTDQEIALAQARVNDLYGKFLDKVSESRHIPRGADTDPTPSTPSRKAASGLVATLSA